jgi:hypothetical protein
VAQPSPALTKCYTVAFGRLACCSMPSMFTLSGRQDLLHWQERASVAHAGVQRHACHLLSSCMLAGHIPYLLRHDYHIQALEWANKYGGICRFSLGGQHIILVSGDQGAARNRG